MANINHITRILDCRVHRSTALENYAKIMQRYKDGHYVSDWQLNYFAEKAGKEMTTVHRQSCSSVCPECNETCVVIEVDESFTYQGPTGTETERVETYYVSNCCEAIIEE